VKKKKKIRRARARKIKRKVVKRLRKKIIFLVIDGLADLPLDTKTPLAAARKPNLNYLAERGMTGEIIPVEKKLWSDLTNASISHIANISLLGYDPRKFNLSRGTLEAVGTDIPYREGHLALRCNFATVDKELVLLDRRVGRNSLGLDEIARYINENLNIGIPFIFKRTYEHRAVLVIKEKLSDKISHSDPFVAGEKVRRVEALTTEAEKSAKIVQEFVDKSRQLIEFHPANEQRIKHGLPPANYIVTREAGNKLKDLLPHFTKKYNVKAVCIAESGVMKATCMLAGFDSITVPELKFEPTLEFIFDNIEDALSNYDFVYAHIKGPDEPAHDGNFHRKREMIETIDRYVEKLKNFNGILVVTTDHITSCRNRRHEYGAVPLLVVGRGKDRVKTFDEFSVKAGRLKLIDGKKLWKIVFKK
jgi:2,3-bisphosphoglycerate-independent phosphoglycerate mutase